MSPTEDPRGSVRIEPDMFVGPDRLAPITRALRRLPVGISERALAGLAIADGFVRASRVQHALAFATAHGARGVDRWRLALAVLANHGRFVAEEMLLGVTNLGDLRRGATIEGAEHLTGLSGGAILLGFHLGPPRSALVLRACGYPVRFTGRWEIAGRDERWSKVLDAGEGVRLPPGAPRGRAEGLRRILNLLRAGAIVYLAADGPFGREAFHLEVPGGQVTVRLGWLALRRAVHVPTLPVLAHRQGHERVICVHPPLPDVDPDPGADAARCKTILEPLVHDYVRRFPSQCRYVVLPN